MNTSVQKIVPAVPASRMAPHNAEAERQLLGAILVNNETFYRVSDFLDPEHFLLPPHQEIYEMIGKLVRAGKIASPITLKTFFGSDAKIADLSATQYLLRLAADATAVINVEDYGRTIYDLAVRRNLIRIGEDMVNIAFDAPIDMPPDAQIDDAERRLFALAETGSANAGFSTFGDALAEPSTWRPPPISARGNCRAVQRLARPRQSDGRAAALGLDRARRASRHGQDVACHQHRLSTSPGLQSRGTDRTAR